MLKCIYDHQNGGIRPQKLLNLQLFVYHVFNYGVIMACFIDHIFLGIMCLVFFKHFVILCAKIEFINFSYDNLCFISFKYLDNFITIYTKLTSLQDRITFISFCYYFLIR